MTITRRPAPLMVRIPLAHGNRPGEWVGLHDLLIRRPGDIQSTPHRVWFTDATGVCRREFGEAEQPGPYAYLTRVTVTDDDHRATIRVGDGDLVVLDTDVFAVRFDGADVKMDPMDGAPTQTEMVPHKGISLTIARAAFADPSVLSARADGLTLVGFLHPEDRGGRIVAPVDPACQIVEPVTQRPAVALEIREFGSGDKILAAIPVLWSDTDLAYVRSGQGSASGNYAGWSDNRVGSAVEKILGHPFYGAIAIHDRFRR